MMNRELLVLAMLLLIPVMVYCILIEIDDSGGLDYTSIQEGIDNSVSGDTLLVYPGHYQENINFGGRDIVVISLFYATGDSSYIENTIIGDVEDGCLVTFENMETPAAILGGLTIREGWGSGFPDYRSGGINCLNFSSPTLRDLNIYENNYGAAGGIYCEYSDPLIERCHIHDNTGHIPYYGGGITLYHSNAHIRDCLIENNGAYICGGGICVFEMCDPLIEDCIIRGNDSDGGGGIYAQACNLTLRNVLITGNDSSLGGGITLYYYVNPDFENVEISNNDGSNGGGIFFNTVECEITSLKLTGNTASSNAGITVINSNIVLNDMIICNNEVDHDEHDGSSMIVYYGSSVIIENSTFSGNTSDGASIIVSGSSSLVMHNNIFNDTGMSIQFQESDQGNNNYLSISYCDIVGGEESLDCDNYGSYEWGEGNISVYPGFACPEQEDWRLMYYSPCIDAGDPASEYDLDGTICDLGALYYDQEEFVYPEINIPEYLHFESGEIVEMDFSQYVYDINPDELVLSVSGNENVLVDIAEMLITISCVENWAGVELLTFYVNDNSGRLVSSDEMTVDVTKNIIYVPEDFAEIQTAIEQANEDSTRIIVAPGEYHENLDFLGKNIELVSYFEATGDTVYINETIIDGDSLGTVITITGCEQALVKGFTIRNGYGDYLPYEVSAGGIKIDNCNHVEVSNVHIEENTGVRAGIFSMNSILDLHNTKIFNNDGSAVYIEEEGTSEIINLEINNNNEFYGSSIYANTYSHEFPLYISGLRYINNYSTHNPVGLTISGIMNSAIIDITASNNGQCYSAIRFSNLSNTYLSDITATNNDGSGIGILSSYGLTIDRVIIKDNTIVNGGSEGMLTVHACDYNDPIIISNALISNNNSHMRAGAIYINDSNLIILNSTIIDNITTRGAAIVNYFNSVEEPYLINSIVYNNEPGQIQLGYPAGRMKILHVDHCDVEGGEEGVLQYENALLYWEEGNIDENPLFTGSGENPFTLMETSPCIDAGTLDFPVYFEMPETDLAGNPRVSGDFIDMGCYEYQYPGSEEENEISETGNRLWCYPNPFNPETTIGFYLEKEAEVDIKIYNIRGQLVKELHSGIMEMGRHNIIWHGDNESGSQAGSGVYFYQLKAGDLVKTKKMMLMR